MKFIIFARNNKKKMKRLFNILFVCIAVSAAFCVSCDEKDGNYPVNTEKFPVGTVNWSSDVTSQQREVISELINNMVCVDATGFYMGAQSRNYDRPNYLTGYTTKDTIWDANLAILTDTITRKKVKYPYTVVYYNNGIPVGPVIQVDMPSYYIGKFEITQGQWDAVMNRRPTGTYCKVDELKGTAAWYKETGLGDNIAAYNISHDDAVEFCQTLSRKTGLKFRLPTEAEWECAARGGAATRGYRYSGSDSYNDVAWNYYNSCNVGLGHEKYGVHAGGELMPNELGIYDMSGNVAEWVSNAYYWYDYRDNRNPQGKAVGDTLIVRGGSWTQMKTNELSSGNRRKFIQSTYSEQSFLDAIAFCGFRVVLSK